MSEDLSNLLTQIWIRLGQITDQDIKDRQVSAYLMAQIAELVHRMTEIEKRQRRRRSLGLLVWLRQVASPKEWIIGLVLATLALKGALTAAQWKEVAMSLIGAAP